MPRRSISLAAALVLAGIAPAKAAHAVLHAGQVAPDFHKTGLDHSQYTLYQFRGKVVVLFLLGYN
jgi:peroxiredoxin